MLQDRNIHRDAQALRKAITVELITPQFGVDQDEPMWITQPRYNWRLSDLHGSAQGIGTADLVVKAQSVPPFSALGSPQLGQAAAVTFTVEEFWRRSGFGAVFTNVAADAAKGFDSTGIATVLDGFWGVWLLEVNQSSDKQIFAGSPIMAFATEADALRNCPQVRPSGSGEFNGRCAILTINAVGGDFIAGTTNTDAALVAAFNTAPQDGHVFTMDTATPAPYQATLGQQLKDASGTNILQGRGGLIDPESGDWLCLSVRSTGASVLTGANAVVEYRPWPSGGEGLGDTSVSQNRPSFVP